MLFPPDSVPAPSTFSRNELNWTAASPVTLRRLIIHGFSNPNIRNYFSQLVTIGPIDKNFLVHHNNNKILCSYNKTS